MEVLEISESQYIKAAHIVPNIQGYSLTVDGISHLVDQSGGISNVYADIYSQGGQDSAPKSMYNIYLDLGIIHNVVAFTDLVREIESMYLLGYQKLLERYWREFRILK